MFYTVSNPEGIYGPGPVKINPYFSETFFFYHTTEAFCWIRIFLHKKSCKPVNRFTALGIIVTTK